MQSTTQTAIVLFAIVLILGVCAEKYTILGNYEGVIDNKNSHRKFHSLDTPFNVRRLSNDRKQTKILVNNRKHRKNNRNNKK